MAIMDLDNIKGGFMRLCGLEEESFKPYEEMLRAVAAAIEGELDGELIKTADDRAVCEFAAAAEGFFRLVCQKAAADKVIVTAAGAAVEKYDEEGRIKAAMKLRDSAAARAERFTFGKGFAFTTVEEKGGL